jgi:vacuolar iron transporter family protein
MRQYESVQERAELEARRPGRGDIALARVPGTGTAALLTAIGLAAAALFAVGATIGVFNGRPPIRPGLRQFLVGAVAAAVTYGVGHLIGVSAS